MSAASQSTVAAQPARWQVATGNVGIRDPAANCFRMSAWPGGWEPHVPGAGSDVWITVLPA
jgi:hypothetical protein